MPSHAPPWTVVFALEREAAPFRRLRSDVPIIMSGIGADRVAQAVDRHIKDKAPGGILMCGFAGALRDNLHVGEVVVAKSVVEMTDADPAHAVRHSPTIDLSNQQGVLLTVNRLIAGQAEKRALGASYQADIVDMETSAVARVCNAANVPWASVRVVSDEVNKEVAPEIEAMLAEGTVSKSHLILSLLKRPSLIYHYYGLAKDTNYAAKRLAETLNRLLPR